MRIFVYVVFILLAGGAVAQAQDKTSAKAAYESGKRAYAEKRYSEAAVLFGYSFELSGNPDLLFNRAQALRLAGDLSQALTTYKLFLKARPDSENAELAQIKIDEITIAQLPTPKLATANEVFKPNPPTVQARALQPVQPSQQPSTLPPWALKVGAITTGVFAVAAITTSLAADNRYSDLKNSCGKTPYGCAESEIDGMRSRGNWATVLWILTGLSATATGVVFAIEHNQQQTGVSVAGRF